MFDKHVQKECKKNMLGELKQKQNKAGKLKPEERTWLMCVIKEKNIDEKLERAKNEQC